MSDIQKILEGFGLSTESIHKIKLGRGVVGKLSAITIIVVLVLGGITLKLNNWIAISLAFLLIMGFAIYSINRIIRITYEKPEVAILEGAEFLAYQQIIRLGAKGFSPLQQIDNPQPDPDSPSLPLIREDENTESENE